MSSLASTSTSTPAIKKTICYRFFCDQCIEVAELRTDQFHVRKGVGAGKDIDGSYDAGYSQTTATCPICNSEVSFCGNLEEAVRAKRIFKIVK